ncbi:VHS and GAT domain-containing protein [Aspergillus ruber CBS 135680]|uniref:GAT-like domain-containing protein n=1 Tax=Aspergillus ruber (strain CBS 135680) TaxID=1388766 RepID=A0A017SQ72_ASPRC|nr:GAT-like domain-containing protein [Aspergillus ruber CBS 135680]EYE99082.1 GAT-like domain-containing protein [Aspergillus ruber CBS 135680]
MKRVFTSLTRRASNSSSATTYADDSPEAVILREVAAFCDSGNSNSEGTDYVHLPAIVESAESSPNAAKEAAHRIRKILSDPVKTPGHMQYNAIMLVRILIDNPGHTFARNLDAKFTSTVKDLLRQGRDMNAQQFLRETLEFMETQRSWDEDLATLVAMWKKEKERYNKARTFLSQQRSQNHFGAPRPAHGTILPPPDELAARVEEARNSSKLLLQIVQSTPPAEILENEIIAEFSHRCQTASRAVQAYINSTNPAPDEDTLLTLIETNDEISVALSKHQRAVLNARKALGSASSQSPVESGEVAASSANARPVPAPPLPQRDMSVAPELSSPVPAPVPAPAFAPVPSPVPAPATAPDPTANTSTGPGRFEYRSEDFQVQNPFADNHGIYGTPSHYEGNQQTNTYGANGPNGQWQQNTERTV